MSSKKTHVNVTSKAKPNTTVKVSDLKLLVLVDYNNWKFQVCDRLSAKLYQDVCFWRQAGDIVRQGDTSTEGGKKDIQQQLQDLLEAAGVHTALQEEVKRSIHSRFLEKVQQAYPSVLGSEQLHLVFVWEALSKDCKHWKQDEAAYERAVARGLEQLERQGKLTAEELQQWRDTKEPRACYGTPLPAPIRIYETLAVAGSQDPTATCADSSDGNCSVPHHQQPVNSAGSAGSRATSAYTLPHAPSHAHAASTAAHTNTDELATLSPSSQSTASEDQHPSANLQAGPCSVSDGMQGSHMCTSAAAPSTQAQPALTQQELETWYLLRGSVLYRFERFYGPYKDQYKRLLLPSASADEMIAAVVHQVQTLSPVPPICIISDDTDFFQLLKPGQVEHVSFTYGLGAREMTDKQQADNGKAFLRKVALLSKNPARPHERGPAFGPVPACCTYVDCVGTQREFGGVVEGEGFEQPEGYKDCFEHVDKCIRERCPWNNEKELAQLFEDFCVLSPLFRVRYYVNLMHHDINPYESEFSLMPPTLKQDLLNRCKSLLRIFRV